MFLPVVASSRSCFWRLWWHTGTMSIFTYWLLKDWGIDVVSFNKYQVKATCEEMARRLVADQVIFLVKSRLNWKWIWSEGLGREVNGNVLHVLPSQNTCVHKRRCKIWTKEKDQTVDSLGNIKTSLSPIGMKQATVLCPQRHPSFSLISRN